jgi:CO/xanthine dehydrogenase Mo-binding subunit
MDQAGAWAEIDDGGTAKIVTGVTEIGEGILTVLAQVAAEELGVKPENVMIGENDTSRSPEAAHAGATRQTYMIGNAVALACRQAKNKLFTQIAKEWNVDIQTLKAHDGEIWSEGTNYRIPMGEAIKICKKKYGVVPVGGENYTSHHTGLHPEDGSGKPWQAYVFGGQVAEVEVDTATGEVQLLGIWACHDVGRAINPKGVEGQVEGGVVQAVGQALMENFELDNGKTSSGNLAKYILPTSLDVPKVKTKIVEDPDPLSPLGAKGIGEPAMVPTAPAIMNAIYDAVGVRIKSLPATPEKILSALREKQRKSLNKSLN